MKKRMWVVTLAVLFILSSILVGCVEKPSAGGDKGKTLIYGRGADSVGLDPIQEEDGESLKVTKQIVETLVDYKEENTEVVPNLAESWEKKFRWFSLDI